MVNTIATIIELILVVAALVVCFLFFKYPKQLLITLPKTIVLSITKIFKEETIFGLSDIFSKKKKRMPKQK